jgi:regulatory protein
LRDKLRRKAAEPDTVDGVLQRLREYGFINDAAFAENYAAVRKDQNFGKMRVLRDLRQRRVAGAVAEDAVQRTFEGENEEELVSQFLTRKFRNVNLAEYLQNQKHLASAFRKLRYAGFSAGVSIRVLKHYAAHADDLEGIDEQQEEM